MIQQLIWPWHYECEITRDKQNSSYQTTCCHDTHQATVVQLFFYNTVFILWFITTSNAIDWRKNTAAFDAFVQELSNWVRFCIFAPFFNLRALGAHFKQFLLNTRLQFVRSVAGVHLFFLADLFSVTWAHFGDMSYVKGWAAADVISNHPVSNRAKRMMFLLGSRYCLIINVLNIKQYIAIKVKKSLTSLQENQNSCHPTRTMIIKHW